MVPTLTLNSHALVEITFFILLFFFSVYAIFLSHHWFTYGTSRKTSMLALAIYLGGGAILFMILGGVIQLM